jgi:hypothetical protein
VSCKVAKKRRRHLGGWGSVPSFCLVINCALVGNEGVKGGGTRRITPPQKKRVRIKS